MRRHILVAALVAAIAVVIDAGYVATRLTVSLDTVQESLSGARDAVGRREIDVARIFIRDAREASEDAVSATGHPSFTAASVIPDVLLVRHMSQAAELTARAGDKAIYAADILNGGGEPLSFVRRATFDLSRFERAVQPMMRAAQLIDDARQVVADAPAPLSGRLSRFVVDTRATLANLEDSVRRAALTLRWLPRFLGRDGHKRYLVGFQSLGEARATGGMIGLYSILHTEGGRIRMGRVRTVNHLPTSPTGPPVVSPTRSFARTYSSQRALVQVQQANVTPRFPLAAEVVLRMYEAVGGRPLDGMIAVDPVAFAGLLEVTGPVSAPQLDLEVGPENAARVLMHDAYTRINDHKVQSRYLADLTNRLWQHLESGGANSVTLPTVVAALAADKHIQIYSRHPSEQRMIARLGISGDFIHSGRGVQFVYNNNYGMNKIDYFHQRHVDTRVALRSNGSAIVKTAVTITNNSPRLRGSVLFDVPGRGARPGENRMILNVLLPFGAIPLEARSAESTQSRPPFLRESGRTVVWKMLKIPAGETTTFEVTYRWPNAVEDERLELVLYPQTRADPETYSLTVDAGTTMTVASESTPTHTFHASGTLEAEKTFTLRTSGVKRAMSGS